MYNIKRTLIAKKTVVLTLTGTEGTCNITIAGLTRLCTFTNTLTGTALNFVYLWAADYLAVGIVVAASSGTIVIDELVQGVGFYNPIIENITINLNASGIAYITYPEPITLAEARTFILDRTDDDAGANALLSELITSAREQAELYCNRSFIPQIIEYSEQVKTNFSDPVPEFTLPFPNHISISEVKVDGVLSALNSDYTVSGINRLTVNFNNQYFTTDQNGTTFYIKYIAGDCSITAKSAILQIMKDMYENRGKDAMSGNGFKMLQPLRIYS